jgi:hypothetical protein
MFCVIDGLNAHAFHNFARGCEDDSMPLPVWSACVSYRHQAWGADSSESNEADNRRTISQEEQSAAEERKSRHLYCGLDRVKVRTSLGLSVVQSRQ